MKSKNSQKKFFSALGAGLAIGLILAASLASPAAGRRAAPPDSTAALSWNTFLGGGGDDEGYSAIVDGSGNLYLTGTSAADWGTPLRAYTAAADAFVAKLDATGALQWHTFLGGSGGDEGYSLALDGSGNIYVAGFSNASWGAPLRAYSADYDAFVARLDANGALQWNTFLGGGGSDNSYSITLDDSNNLYLSGFSNADWGAPLRAYSAGTDAFAARLDSGSGALLWNTFLGGGGSDYSYAISAEASGNIYLAGDSSAAWGSPVTPYSAATEAFAARLDANGALQWNTFLGGGGDDFGDFIIVADSGNIYISGYSDGAWGAPLRAYTAGLDAFTARLDANGALQWNTFLGGSGTDYGEYLAVDASDNVHLSGTSAAAWGLPVDAYTGGYDAFAVRLDANGALHWNTFLGGSGDDAGYAIAVDGSDNIYLTGASDSAWGAPLRAYSLGADAFAAQFAAPAETPPGAFSHLSPADQATGVSTSPSLAWDPSSGVTRYEYCYDATNDNACTTWIDNGADASASLSGLSTGTTYTWHVRAVNSFGTTYAEGSATTFWRFTTGSAPGAFTRISPADQATGVSTSPSLSWNPSANAVQYEYCYDTSNDNACSNWIDNGANTSASLSGLFSSSAYYWHVRATNSFGTTYASGSAASFWKFTTGGAPGPFTRLSPANSATGVTTSPSLSWNASASASRYEYCYDNTNDNACSAWVNNGSSTSANLSGLSGGTTYYWHVRAVNNDGATYADGSANAFWSFSTGSTPGFFTRASPLNQSLGNPPSLNLAWNPSSGAQRYEYCYDTSNDNACVSWVNNFLNTSVFISGLSAGTTYYWHVRAVNGIGPTYADGSATAYWSFTTGSAPGAFTRISPANQATGLSTSPNLSWNPSSNLLRYEFCYDASDDNACTTWINNGTTTNVTLNSLAAGTTYYWHVRAINNYGETYANGSAATFWSFTTYSSKTFLPIVAKP